LYKKQKIKNVLNVVMVYLFPVFQREMTTTVEVQPCFPHYTSCPVSVSTATFEAFPESNVTGRLPASAPSLDAGVPFSSAPIIDVNGNVSDGSTSMTSVSPTPPTLALLRVPEDVQHNLAKYLSSGEDRELNLNQTNVNIYVDVAKALNLKKLQKVCGCFLNQNDVKSRPWENNRLLCKLCINVHDKNSIGTDQFCVKAKVPAYAIMFPKEESCDKEHRHVLVMDIRKSKEVQKTVEKRVAKFGNGFAACAAYAKTCPYVFISGGNGKAERVLMKYDVVENKWSTCANLRVSRTKHCMAAVQRCIYIIGGKEGSSIEKYDIDSGNCSELNAKLPVPVHCAAHAVFEDKIYIFGGKTLRNEVQTVQCVDTKQNSVSRLNDLPVTCSGSQAVVVKDKIYIATNHGHMIKYDPKTDQSEMCSQQPFKRKHFIMYERKGFLHIFGGVRTDGKLDEEGTMYKYCPLGDTWRKWLTFGIPLPINASCTIVYPKECPVTPFRKLFGYC